MQLSLDIPRPSVEEVDGRGNGRMTDPAQILQFILAGKSRFTIKSVTTGQRFTFRVSKPKPIEGDARPPVHFVSLLTGQDNESMYSYFGFIKNSCSFQHGGRKAKVTADAKSVQAFAWFFRHVIAAGSVPSTGSLPTSMEFWHEGRCGRCGRALTVPESIRTGFGPECAGRME